MRKSVKFLIGSGAVIAAAAVAWQTAYPTTVYRYRMSVTVSTPEGDRFGDSVNEVKIIRYPRWVTLGQNDREVRVRGEAVAVNLEQRGMLFALLRGEDGYVDYAKHIAEDLYGSRVARSVLGGGNASSFMAVPADKLPMLVRFRDLKDPKTVEKVDAKNLAASFGEGVALKDVKIALVDDAVSSGIEKWLPWLPEYYDQRLDGNRFGSGDAINRIANDLSAGSFSTELSPYGR